MPEILSAVGGVIFGGVVATLLSWFLARGILKATLVSVVKQGQAGTSLAIPDSVVALSHRLKLTPFRLQEESDTKTVEDMYEECSAIKKYSPKGCKEIATLREDLLKADTREDKEDILKRIFRQEMLMYAVENALVTGDVSISNPSRQASLRAKPHDDSHSNIDTDALFSIDEPKDEPDLFYLRFPGDTLWRVVEGRESFRRERMREFFAAACRFDQGVLCKCLNATHRAFDDDLPVATAITAELDAITSQSNPFTVEAVIANHGNRIVMMSPYAALKPVGGPVKSDRVLLTAFSVIDSDGKDSRISPESTSYISVAPQTTKRLYFTSEGTHNNLRLSAAYESGDLRCSIWVFRQRRVRSKWIKSKRVKSGWVKLGEGRMKKQKREAVD